MIEVRRSYRFCASHSLRRPDWSPEENLRVFGTASHPSGHGHNYRLCVVVAGEPDEETGRVVDLEALDAAVEERVISVYDHRNMNVDVPTLKGCVPTMERVLQDLGQRLLELLPGGRLKEVRLRQDEFTEAVLRDPAPRHDEGFRTRSLL